MSAEPLRLTPLEQHVDTLLRFENFERYSAQSASTKVALLGTLPARVPLEQYDPGRPPEIIPYEDRRGT